MPRTSQHGSHRRLVVLLVVLVIMVGGGYFWWQAGFTLDISRFFAAETGVMTVTCGATQNVITWTVDSRANSNSIQRGNNGTKNLPDCADYWCWLPSNNYPHQVPTSGQPAQYVDTQPQQGICHEYRIKYQPQLPSNSVFCPTNCNIVAIAPLPAVPTVDLKCDGTDGPCLVPSGTQATLSWTSVNATTCVASQGWSGTKALSGSEVTAGLTQETTFTVTCTGVGGSATDTVVVNIESVKPAPLTCIAPASLIPVNSGSPVTFSVSGGLGGFAWSAANGSPSAGSGTVFQTSFTHVGLPETQTFQANVRDIGTDEQSTCSVSVQCEAPTCAAPPQGCSYQDANACSCGTLVCSTDSPTPTATPVPTPTPTAVPGELTCAPASQAVAVGQTVQLQASGGGGTFSWSAPGGSPLSSETASSYLVRYNTPGGYTVTVDDGQGGFDQCTVTATSQAVTPTPGQTPTVDLMCDGSNGPCRVAIGVPFNVTWFSSNVTTCSASGAWSGARAVSGSQQDTRQSIGTYEYSIICSGSSGTASDSVTVQVLASVTPTPSASLIPSVAVVDTGPGQASVLALIISAIVTLLYIGYTSTDTFRRREVLDYSRGRKHPDFRG